MELTKEFFEDVYNIRANNEMAEKSLERLVGSKYFSNVAVFYGETWSHVRRIAESRQSGLQLGTKDAWKDLARPELFLAIREIPEDAWLVLIASEEANNYRNPLYRHLVKTMRAGIERFLLDGVRLEQEIFRDEDEWPELSDDDETYIPNALISKDNTEEQAMNNILLQEIRDYLDDEEWLILTADYGMNDELAKSLGISNETLRKRRERIRKRVLILFD